MFGGYTYQSLVTFYWIEITECGFLQIVANNVILIILENNVTLLCARTSYTIICIKMYSISLHMGT